MSSNTEVDHLVVASLLANPMLTGVEIAEITGYTPTTVSRIKKRLQAGLSKNEVAVAAYQMLLRDQVPPELRTKRIKELVEHADRDATSLQAIQYTDDLLRLTPKTQPVQQDPDVNKPMFLLPNATSVTVNISQNKLPRNALGLGRDAVDVEMEEANDTTTCSGLDD
jgi:hypothetical protein